jgi:hypothetical protein
MWFGKVKKEEAKFFAPSQVANLLTPVLYGFITAAIS